jgi:hypothetical protein
VQEECWLTCTGTQKLTLTDSSSMSGRRELDGAQSPREGG